MGKPYSSGYGRLCFIHCAQFLPVPKAAHSGFSVRTVSGVVPSTTSYHELLQSA